MSQTLELLQSPFVHESLKAALIIAVLCSYLGVYVVLKRIVFVGAALAEISQLGAAIAFAAPVMAAFARLGADVPALAVFDHYRPLVMAVVMMLAAVAFFSQQGLGRSMPREAIIGAAFAGAIGLTILVRTKVPAEAGEALEILTGNILGVKPLEISELMYAGIGVGLLQLLFYKEFVLVSFDPEVAQTLGYRSARWELLWYLTLGAMIAVSIHVAGTPLVVAYLVIPPVSALLLSRHLGLVFTLSILFGVLATFGGVLIAVSPANLPISPTIIGCMVALLAIAWLLERVRKLVGRLVAPRPAPERLYDVETA
jgi:ABC-type Mn2+/Zn2+ transport system permease subunit